MTIRAEGTNPIYRVELYLTLDREFRTLAVPEQAGAYV
jgi:hypothetical protein